MLKAELNILYHQHGIDVAHDDVSGAWLNAGMVREARQVEMDYFKSMGVYECVPRSEQLQTKGKIIGTRWLDVNKGDYDNPKYRSRLVGKEFKTTPDDALYASTPPLEALRLMMSRVATTGGRRGERELMINYVSRAYFLC